VFYVKSTTIDNGLHGKMQKLGEFRNNLFSRDFVPAYIIVANTIIWFTLIYAAFNDAVTSLYAYSSESIMIFILHYLGIAISAVLGTILFPRARAISLFAWILGGVITSVFVVTVPSNGIAVNMAFSLFLGASIGAGLSSCLAYFADLTSVENRGVRGGIVWATIGFGILVLAMLVGSLSSALTVYALTAWRALGLIAFLFVKDKEKMQSTLAPQAFSVILHRTDFLLYLAPWVMFCLVNFVETPIVQNLFGESFVLVGLISFALAGVFAFAGGVVADTVGRKRVIMSGFIMLGIEYALMSIFYESPVAWYLYTVFDGIAWGMFSTVFFMALWGDLGGTYEKSRYYLFGGLSYVLSGFLSIVVTPYLQVIPPSLSFSLASFFLFLAVLPLVYAPETLPERKIKERELKEYIEKAKKTKKKYI
jgi:MFS family permease